MNDNSKRTLKFRGIDDFNRPVFKVLEKSYYMGSTNKLFSHDTNPKEIVKYFKNHKDDLIFFGYSFGCEPEGGKIKDTLKIIIQEL